MNVTRIMEGSGRTDSEKASVSICHLSQGLRTRKSWAKIIAGIGKSMCNHPEAGRGVGTEETEQLCASHCVEK